MTVKSAFFIFFIFKKFLTWIFREYYIITVLIKNSSRLSLLP